MYQGAEYQEDDIQPYHEEPGVREAVYPAAASAPVPECTAVQTRSQTLVPRSPSRLPYVAVCSVGLLVVVVATAVTAHKLHTGQYAIELFNNSTALLLQPGSNGSAPGGNAAAQSRHLVKHERRKALAADTTCKTDVCVWAENYLRGRLNLSVNPCIDFYGHVCSRHWAAGDTGVHSRVYRERTSGMMMLDVERFFRDYLRENEQRYHQFPGVFLHQAISLLPKCQSEEKDDKNLTSLRRLLEEYNLAGWPYRKAPRDADIVTVSAFVDRDLGVFPFARVFLRKPFEHDRGYTVHVDAPSLTLKRYNLAYDSEPPENFTRKVALALSLLDRGPDVAERAADIALLENKLHNITATPRFIAFQDRLKTLAHIDRKGKWSWKQYLTIVFQDIVKFDYNDSVAVMSPDYVSNLASILNETDVVTLLNYIGYRLVVHMSPLLPKIASPLLRLSHDDHLEFTSDRLQACMHMLERVYKHGMRFFGRMTFSKRNTSLLLKHYDYSMSSLEVELKHAVTDRLLSSSSWLGRSAIGIGVDKLENMRFVFLGSTDDINTVANYYNFIAKPLDPSQLLESFRELQAGTMGVYWETKPPKEDLDARYDHTALSPGYEYFFARNLLFVPHSNIAFLNDITKRIDPVLYPLVLGDILRGMYGAVDRRGATVNHNLALATWWDADEMSKYSQMELCFEEQYYVAIRDLIGENFETRMKLEENIADNSILGPLHDVYMKALTSSKFAGGLKLPVDGRQLDMEQLFFVLYAVGLCDNPDRESWKRKLSFGEIPGKLRVNIPLMNFHKFAAAFGCTRGFPMNPARKCMIW